MAQAKPSTLQGDDIPLGALSRQTSSKNQQHHAQARNRQPKHPRTPSQTPVSA
jgi:hypothetical protein